MVTCEQLSFEAFQDAGEAWSELVEASAHPLPFSSHPWVCSWWRYFGAGHEFAAFVVRDGRRFLAGVPLVIRRIGIGSARVAVAEIAGTGPVPTRGMGLADKADLVMRPGQPEAGGRLLAALSDLPAGVDLLYLKGLDRQSETLRALQRVAGRQTWIGPRSVSPYLPLAASLVEVLRARSSKFRKTLRRSQRELAAMGRSEISRLGRGDDPLGWMAEVLAISRRSWQARGGTDLFRHPDLRAFFLDLAARMAARGWLDLHLLRIDGVAMAYDLGFDFGQRVYSYARGFDPSIARLSPGSQLTAEVIAGACRRGRVEYDLLRGAEGYKMRWSEQRTEELELVLHAGAPGARLFAAVGVHVKRRLKAWPWLARLDERITGLLTRLRHGG